MDTVGAKSRLPDGVYLDFCRCFQHSIIRVPFHLFVRWHTDDEIRLLWMDRGTLTPTCWGTQLTGPERDAFRDTVGNHACETDGQFSLTPTGFGPLRIHSLRPGDRFLDLQGRSGIFLRAHNDAEFDVILFPETIKASRQRWVRNVCVFVPDADTARSAHDRERRTWSARSAAGMPRLYVTDAAE